LRYVRGLRREAGERIVRERGVRAFASMGDLMERAALRADEVETLAEAGALAALGLERRAALWQVARLGHEGPLLRRASDEKASPLAEMTPLERTAADYRTTGMTTGPHPMAHLRATLDRRGVVPCAGLARLEGGRWVRTAGAVIVRQRPGTAKGFLFLTLEDETGIASAIGSPHDYRARRALLVGSSLLLVEGRLQQQDGVTAIRASRFEALDVAGRRPATLLPAVAVTQSDEAFHDGYPAAPSRDFH
jgi:error-prone DNA polymerase